MTKAEIITRFREENPEATTNVVSKAILQSWCEIGNLETCLKARLIRGQGTFNSIIGERKYNLNTELTNFYDIDELPGGGVAYDDNRLQLVSLAELDEKRPSWRTESNGATEEYWRRNEFLYLARKASAVVTIEVYTVDIPDTFDDDTKTPYNQFPHLEVFHYALVLYLKMRTFMGKIKSKPEHGQMAFEEYQKYVVWMKEETERGIYSNIIIRPPTNYRGTSRYYTR